MDNQPPACRENLYTFPTFAYAGPLNLRDARSGEFLFQEVSEFKGIPKEIRKKLPEGYGLRVRRPGFFIPTSNNPRPGYTSGYGELLGPKGPSFQIQLKNISDHES